MTSHAKRTVFFVSDGTGITAETIGHSLFTQFEAIDFKQVRIPFVDSVEKAEEVRGRIRQEADRGESRPIIISTFVDPSLSEIIYQSPGLVMDVFDTFLGIFEDELGVSRSPRVGHAHGLVDYHKYESRMDATNYALKHDDGADINYQNADVILVGVSRSGKTPTCLYLALHYGIKAANYPLTEEDLGSLDLPPRLKPHREKLFGLTIDPYRLQQIREARRPNSRYAELRQCREEVADAEGLFRMHDISCLNTTSTSIEEIAGKILLSFKMEKKRL
ncbi:MAG: pyruvate, water dikinase regulatory protein [Xanthomonadales bacterium]|nr:pyruvate, water dikinase regulatory protein [Xanthomonadales bacterium]